MSLKAALPAGVLSKLPIQVGSFRAFKPANLRTSVISHAKIEEINTDDTPGVSTLLDRDFKVIDLNEDAFAEDVSTVEIEEEIEKEPEPTNQPAPSPPPETPSGAGPKRSKDAINAGLDLFAQANYAGAVEMFQLALELPGSGFMRMAGSPKEFACASEGEEQAALYNMACAYCKMNQASAALTCLEALLESGFEDYNALKTDADLVVVRGPELDKLIGKYDGVLAKLFGKKKKEPAAEKPWIQW